MSDTQEQTQSPPSGPSRSKLDWVREKLGIDVEAFQRDLEKSRGTQSKARESVEQGRKDIAVQLGAALGAKTESDEAAQKKGEVVAAEQALALAEQDLNFAAAELALGRLRTAISTFEQACIADHERIYRDERKKLQVDEELAAKIGTLSEPLRVAGADFLKAQQETNDLEGKGQFEAARAACTKLGVAIGAALKAKKEYDDARNDELSNSADTVNKQKALVKRRDDAYTDYSKARGAVYSKEYKPVGELFSRWVDEYNGKDYIVSLKNSTTLRSKQTDLGLTFDQLDSGWAAIQKKGEKAAETVEGLIGTFDSFLGFFGVESDLQKLDPNKAVALARDLIESGKAGSRERKALANLLKSMKLDKKFLDDYAKKSEAVADDLAGDDDLKEAKKNWKEWSKDAESREKNFPKVKALMEKIVAIQCKQLGMPVPEVEIYEEPTKPGSCGYFSPNDGKIHINKYADATWDLKELIDTMTHENTHNYQDRMIKQLHDGQIKEGDDTYMPAVMFELNGGPGGYITPDEARQIGDRGAYDAQPMESHAWKTGGEIAQRTIGKL